jgi:UDP-glucose 4-epimerase
MNIFVTGGAGYIGSATAEALLTAGHNVTVYDSLVTGHREAVPAEVEFIQGDLADSHSLALALTSQKFDAVMHFAAFIEAGESMKDPGKFFRNNLVNSLSLMDMAVRAGVKRFVLSSTAAVYQSSEEPLSEESPLGPTNTYGYTKLAVEQSLDWYRQIHGLRFAALRYFNACGARPGHGEAHQPESHLIPRVIQVALGAGRGGLIFTGRITRPRTEPASAITSTFWIWSRLTCWRCRRWANTTNWSITSVQGNGYSVREVIEATKQVSGVDIKVVESPRRPGDPARLVASSDKIRRELGWKPQHDNLHDILGSAWEWHKNNPKGYA